MYYDFVTHLKWNILRKRVNFIHKTLNLRYLNTVLNMYLETFLTEIFETKKQPTPSLMDSLLYKKIAITRCFQYEVI